MEIGTEYWLETKMEPPDSVQSLIEVGFYEFGQYQSSWLCGFSLAVPEPNAESEKARS